MTPNQLSDADAREYAIDVLNHYTDEKMSENKVARALLSRLSPTRREVDAEKAFEDMHLRQLGWNGSSEVMPTLDARTRHTDRKFGWNAAIEWMRTAPPTDSREAEGWFLSRSSVNEPQTESIGKLIKRAKHAHFVDVRVRINGQWEEYQADWIKHLKHTPPQPAQEPPYDEYRAMHTPMSAQPYPVAEQKQPTAEELNKLFGGVPAQESRVSPPTEGGQLPGLADWLLAREQDIAAELEDLGRLRETFKAVIGREPKA